MVSSARIDMTASVFMASIVGFECGQKRQRLARFQDVSSGACWLRPSHTRPAATVLAKFVNNSRRIALKRAMPNDVGIMTMLVPVLILVRLNIQQREGAENIRQIGRRGLMQIGLVELTEAGHAE